MQPEDAITEQAIRDALRERLDERTLDAFVDQGRSTTLEQAAENECQDAQPA
ncbi:MAG TPA: hypothetical protein VME22_11090 [Solirubrobacteraceae bacterium]|nr:hypothetical protein [Solirubrobacteraceae bacterium]